MSHTGCTCKTPGYCERHGCVKTEAWWKLCQTREDYFQLWEEGRGPGQKAKPKNKRPRKRCAEKKPRRAKNPAVEYVETTAGIYEARMAICRKCEFWYGGKRCKKLDLGCARTHRKAVVGKNGKCPVGKWDAIDPELLLPAVDKVAVVCCYYNTCDYETPLKNYYRFAEGVKLSGGELYTAELAFDEQEFSLPDAQVKVRGSRDRNLLWQKERLLNLAIEAVPADVDAIAWLDSDVMFNDPEWIDKSKEALRRFYLIQPWEQVLFLDKTGRVTWEPRSAAWYWHHDRRMSHLPGVAHPGFAWVIRADIVRRNKLYEEMVVGGGDTMMVPGFFDVRVESIDFLNDNWRTQAATWAANMYEDVRGLVGYLPGQIRHLFHGSLSNRQYAKRWRETREGKFDPATDVEIDDTGLLAWTDHALKHKAPMVNWVKRYFSERREDG